MSESFVCFVIIVDETGNESASLSMLLVSANWSHLSDRVYVSTGAWLDE